MFIMFTCQQPNNISFRIVSKSLIFYLCLFKLLFFSITHTLSVTVFIDQAAFYVYKAKAEKERKIFFFPLTCCLHRSPTPPPAPTESLPTPVSPTSWISVGLFPFSSIWSLGSLIHTKKIWCMVNWTSYCNVKNSVEIKKCWENKIIWMVKFAF